MQTAVTFQAACCSLLLVQIVAMECGKIANLKGWRRRFDSVPSLHSDFFRGNLPSL